MISVWVLNILHIRIAKCFVYFSRVLCVRCIVKVLQSVFFVYVLLGIFFLFLVFPYLSVHPRDPVQLGALSSGCS